MITPSQRDALQACRAFGDTGEEALVSYRDIFSDLARGELLDVARADTLRISIDGLLTSMTETRRLLQETIEGE